MFTYPVYTYLVHATWLFTHLYVYRVMVSMKSKVYRYTYVDVVNVKVFSAVFAHPIAQVFRRLKTLYCLYFTIFKNQFYSW